MLWRIYVVFFAFLMITGYSTIDFRIWEYLDFIISCVAFFGFASFAFGHKTLRPWFWKAWLIIIVLWDFSYNNFIPPVISGYEGHRIISYLTALIFLAPEYLGLYLYSFQNMLVRIRRSE